MTETATQPKPREFVFTPNRGAQDKFLRSTAKYPAMICGQGAGKSWGGSAKLVLNHCRYPGADSLAVAPTHQNLRQIIIPALEERLTEAGVEYRTNYGDMEIITPTLSSKILLHSGLNAERVVGFEVGCIWIDEPARIPDFQEPKRNLWKNCIGRLRDARVPPEQRQLFITGTHEGKSSWVYRKWEKKTRPGFVMFRGSTLENPSAQAYAKELIAEYGAELARQYVFGHACEESGAALAYELIVSMQDVRCRKHVDWEQLRTIGNPIFIGMDIGRKKSLTVFWVVTEIEKTLVTVAVHEMREATFQSQARTIDRFASLPSFRKLCIDSTYNPQSAEDAAARWGTRIEPVTFTRATKLELCQALIRAAQNQTLRIPFDETIVSDFFSVKRVVSTNGAVQYQAPFSADGHADRFFAATLAVRAAATGQHVPIEYIPGPEFKAAGLRFL